MFSYATDVLHLSEAEAYLRIAAARASRRHPVLLTMLDDGRLHLIGGGDCAEAGCLVLHPEASEAASEAGKRTPYVRLRRKYSVRKKSGP